MLRRRLSPEDLISAIYEEEGFYEVERGADPDSAYLSRLILSDGKRELVVSILDEGSLVNRGALQDVLLQAEKLRSKFQGVCIAVPRKYARAIDEDVMALHGLGLIIYDKLGAEELIPPKIKESSEVLSEGKLKRGRIIGSREIVELRNEISKLVRAFEEIEARLDRLEKEQRNLASRLSRIEKGTAQPRDLPKQREIEVKARSPSMSRRRIPSYLADNPWIDILSRRE